jgi:hypothetical protein
MTETIEEPVSVMALYDPNRRSPMPQRIWWNNRDFAVSKVAYCRAAWVGKTLHHIFAVFDGTAYFRLDFNTGTMQWVLKDVSDSLPA